MSIQKAKETVERKHAIVMLVFYALILALLVYVYQDVLIGITAIVIFGVLLFQFLVLEVRERRRKTADTDDQS